MPTAKKTAPARSKTEELAAEATPAVKPEGSPALFPFVGLPRRKRAHLLRALETVSSRQDTLDVQDEGGDTLADAAAVYDLLADIEDLLRTVAADVEVFDAWAAECGDEDLAALLTWYMERFQP